MAEPGREDVRDAVEGTGAVPSFRLYTETAGSEADYSLSILSPVASATAGGGYCAGWMLNWVRLLDYDAKEGQAPPCVASCTLRQRSEANEEIGTVVFPQRWRPRLSSAVCRAR